MRCCVKNCNNDTKTTENQGTTFHPFPDDADIFKSWTEALGLTGWEAKTKAVCSEHFRDEDFYVSGNGHINIKSDAVPIDNDSILSLDSPATFKVCRICLSMSSKMYQLTENRLEEKFKQITGIHVGFDNQPRQVCWECAARLHACAAFRDKAIRSEKAVGSLLHNGRHMTMRDAKTISRSQNLKTFLISKYYEPNNSDFQYVKDNEISVKRERQMSKDTEKEESKEEPQIPQIMEVEIKDETSNGIFFDEFDHFSDSDDDKTLSEVISKPKKEKKKHVKKKEKPLKNVKAVKRKNEEDNPSSTMEKYKTSDVKRRRTQDALDESLFTITTMTYEEQIAEIQKRQESVKYTAAPFKCNACYRGFLTKDRYDVHVIRHTDQSGAYECFICKTRMKSARALRKHLTGQHTEKFSCKGCPFITRNRGVAREHEKWHNGTKYQCPHCPTEFDKLTTYLGHIRIKHVSDFVCELCGYTFVSEKGIEVHKKKKHRLNEKNVTLEGPYCEVCDVKFVSEDAHSRHLKLSSRHSSDNDPNRIRNDSQSMNSERKGRCSRQIERRPVIHRERHPSRDNGPVTCEQCGCVLRDLRLYAQHFRRAHPDKNRTKYPAMKTPCMCEQCGRIFQSMCLLKDHMWVHTGEKRFKCDRCDKSFTQKTNLVFHMRVHSATRPTYECPLCGKHFAFYNNRRRHMFIHTGLKPFKCDTCGKCFTTSGEHRAHVEHVHMKKPWPKRARHRGQDWKCTDHMED